MGFKYTYTRLLVTNFKDCFQFYQEVMGLKATFGTANDVYADFDTGGTTIALFDQLEMSKAVGTTHLPAAAAAQDKLCLIFTVDNVDTACLKLKKQGIALITEPVDHPDWGIRTAYLRDPAGNLIEINQPLTQA